MSSSNLEAFYLLLHPRPAYVIGSGKVGEKVNFMAASWVTPVAEEPPRVAISIGVESYTHELINRYQVFTVNVLPVEMLDLIYYLGSVSGKEADKVVECKINIYKCEKTGAPAMEDALAFLGCKVSSHIESEDTTLFIGDVVNLKVLNKNVFSIKRGWKFPEVNIPLHNWGRGFYEVGCFRYAKKRFC